MRTVQARVEGVVQGVAFREYTRREAVARGLRGWVRNLADGSVEALIQGPEQEVAKMLTWLHKGSPRSRVDQVLHRDIDGADPCPSFEIRF